MNINPALWNYAQSLNAGLDWVSTGGGYDYVVLNLLGNRMAVLVNDRKRRASPWL